MNWKYVRLVPFFVSIILATACLGQSPTWALVKLISKGEQVETITESAIVRNCGAVERKTVHCTAGTFSDISVGLAGNVSAGVGVFEGTIETSVSTGLGMGRDNGEGLEFDSPPDGFVFVYTIDKEYRTLTGEALARSSNGSEQKVTYVFHASCSMRIQSAQKLTCSEATKLAPIVILKTPAPIMPTSPSLPPTLRATRPVSQPTVDSNPMKLWVLSANGCQVTINGVLLYVQGPWNWDWGDGVQNSGWFPQTHTYPQSGTYTARVSANTGESNTIKVSVSCP